MFRYRPALKGKRGLALYPGLNHYLYRDVISPKNLFRRCASPGPKAAEFWICCMPLLVPMFYHHRSICLDQYVHVIIAAPVRVPVYGLAIFPLKGMKERINQPKYLVEALDILESTFIYCNPFSQFRLYPKAQFFQFISKVISIN